MLGFGVFFASSVLSALHETGSEQRRTRCSVPGGLGSLIDEPLARCCLFWLLFHPLALR